MPAKLFSPADLGAWDELAKALDPRPFMEEDSKGRTVIRYYLHNDPQTRVLHRDDGPAVEYADGTCSWYRRGKIHREDGPAITRSDGAKEWWVWNQRHRADGPAVERADGTSEWWVQGQWQQ